MNLTDIKCKELDSDLKNNFTDGESTIEDKTFTIDDAVNKVGFGRFQIRLTCLAGLGWFADASEIFILSVIGEFLSCEWKLQRWQIALLTSMVFAGIMVGSPVFGYLADKFGRKKSLSVSLTLLLVFGAVSAGSPTYEWLLALRTLTGFALGGIYQGLTICSEYCPTNMRGKAGFYLCYFWSFGSVAVILLSWLVMYYLENWRVLLAVTALPALFAVLCLKWYPESPRYYLVSHQYIKAVKQLEIMANMNNSDLPPGKLADLNEKISRGRFLDLLTCQYRRTTVLVWYFWFSVGFVYYGIALFTPIIIQNDGLITRKAVNASLNPVVPCEKFTQENYLELLWTSSAEFPSIVIFTFLVEYFRRKVLLGGACLISTALILLLLLETNKTVLLSLLFCARGMLTSIFQLNSIMTSEVFPTTVRAIAMGTGSASSRLGGLITPYVAQVVLLDHPIIAISIFALVTMISAVGYSFIPETKGEQLKETIKQIT